jgi:undecaprenyl-diphosphatase
MVPFIHSASVFLIMSQLLNYYIICAVIQGITEAFPISSSFHLMVYSQWVNAAIVPSKAIAAGLHAGSLLALCLIFRHEFVSLWRGFFQHFGLKFGPNTGQRAQDALFFNGIVLSGLGLIGGATVVYIMQRLFFDAFTLSLSAMAWVYIAFALGMEWANRWQGNRLTQDPRFFSYKDSFLIGLSQVLAMLCSGVSRLGITVTVGRLLGHSLFTATRYSLILGIPVLAGSILFSLPEIVKNSPCVPIFTLITSVTFLCSWPMFHIMLGLSRRESTVPFTLYRILLGILVIWMQAKR